MALRVLLADESSTIKRVIQLALQDFGVEVKSVPIGLDVLSVAQSFQPDIMLADVLLAKRSGYDVCADLKNDPKLGKTPVVLMWSGFMELDEAKATQARVDRRLEKPFDPDQLREVVKALVPRLANNAISEYLKFPKRPEFLEASENLPEEAAPSDNDLMEEDSDGRDDFRHVPLPKNSAKEFSKESDDWSRGDLQKFQIPDEVPENFENIEIPQASDAEIAKSGQFWTSIGDEVPKAKPTPAANQVSDETIAAHPMIPNLDFERAEQIIRQQAREVLESIAWKILPDIAERVVREELQKLLKDSERLEEI
jgi:two-component system cell cycle response regulator